MVRHATQPNGLKDGRPVFLPYRRDARLVREWAIPGTPGLEHRIGGMEKDGATGEVSYDPVNHEGDGADAAQKVANIADAIPLLDVDDPAAADLLVDRLGEHFRHRRRRRSARARKGEAASPTPSSATSNRCRVTPARC